MSVLLWIAVAGLAVLGLSLLVGLAVARILGTIGDEISKLEISELLCTEPLEADAWASVPLTRALERSADVRLDKLPVHSDASSAERDLPSRTIGDPRSK